MNCAIGYRCEVTAVEIFDDDNDSAATVVCCDEFASVITLAQNTHGPDSWRELSAKIEEALLQIHPKEKNK